MDRGHNAKLGRARSHLNGLNRVIAEYRGEWSAEGIKKGKPYLVTQNYNAKTGEYSARIKLTQQPPPNLPLLIGDCLYNLRSALDHLAFALPGIKSDERAIQFPITGSLESFEKGLWRIAHVPLDARIAIADLQPFDAGGHVDKSHPLWLVNELGNEDKHRNLILCGYAGDVQFGFRQMNDVDFMLDHLTGINGPFEQEMEIVKGTFRRAGPNPRVDLYVEPTFDVAFAKEGKARGALVIGTLQKLHDYIRDEVFSKLEGFLL